MKPNPDESTTNLGNTLYTEPYSYTEGGQEYRTVCRIHSRGMSKTLLRKEGIRWVTLSHVEAESTYPLTNLFAKA